MKKRIAAFLSLCLIVVCLFPTCAFAANMEKSQSITCNGVQREHNKKLNNGLPILHKVPPK